MGEPVLNMEAIAHLKTAAILGTSSVMPPLSPPPYKCGSVVCDREGAVLNPDIWTLLNTAGLQEEAWPCAWAPLGSSGLG